MKRQGDGDPLAIEGVATGVPVPVSISGSIPISGTVAIDQTTPGVTNGVQVNAPLPAGTNVIGHVITDAGSVTAVTGTVTITGVSTAANQTNASQKTQIVDGSGNVVGSTGNALDINIKSGNPTTIAVTQSTSPWVVGGSVTATPAVVTVPLVGQAKIAVTGTRVQLGTNTLVNGVIISASPANAAAITVGGATLTNTTDGTGNGYILQAGASVSFACANTNDLYVNGTAGDIVSFAGS